MILLVFAVSLLSACGANDLEYLYELVLTEVELQSHADVHKVVLKDKAQVLLVIVLVSTLRGHTSLLQLLTELGH